MAVHVSYLVNLRDLSNIPRIQFFTVEDNTARDALDDPQIGDVCFVYSGSDGKVNVNIYRSDGWHEFKLEDLYDRIVTIEGDITDIQNTLNLLYPPYVVTTPADLSSVPVVEKKFLRRFWVEDFNADATDKKAEYVWDGTDFHLISTQTTFDDITSLGVVKQDKVDSAISDFGGITNKNLVDTVNEIISSLTTVLSEVGIATVNYSPTNYTLDSGQALDIDKHLSGIDDELLSFVTLDGAQTITGYKTFSNGLETGGADITDDIYFKGAQITDFLDEANMASDSDTAIASQHSIKAYVDNAVAPLLWADGSIPVSGVLSYSTSNIFVDDNELVDKRYVDDSITSLEGSRLFELIGSTIIPKDTANRIDSPSGYFVNDFHALTVDHDKIFIGKNADNHIASENNILIGSDIPFNDSIENTIVIGHLAGVAAPASDNSVIIGNGASFTAGVANSVILGSMDVLSDVITTRSVLIGRNAFSGGSGFAFGSVVIGYEAGMSANSDNSVFIGYQAGKGYTEDRKFVLANNDGELITGDFTSKEVNLFGRVNIGDECYIDFDTSDNLVFKDAFRQATLSELLGSNWVIDSGFLRPADYSKTVDVSTSYNIDGFLFGAQTSVNTVVIGRHDEDISTGFGSVFVGAFSGEGGGSVNDSLGNTFIGYNAGALHRDNKSVFIGYEAGYYETRAYKFMLSVDKGLSYEDSVSKALLFGDFSTGMVRVRSKLELGNEGFYITYDGAGNMVFCDPVAGAHTLTELLIDTTGGGSDGCCTFTGLVDTPEFYAGSEGFIVRVRTDGLGLEFIDPASIGGGGGTSDNLNIRRVIYQNNIFSPGQVVYLDDDGSYKLASSAIIDRLGVFMVIEADSSQFTVCQAGYVDGLTGLSLTTGQYYFVSDVNNGQLTDAEPTLGFSNPIFLATSATAGYVLPFRPSQGGGDITTPESSAPEERFIDYALTAGENTITYTETFIAPPLLLINTYDAGGNTVNHLLTNETSTEFTLTVDVDCILRGIAKG